MVRVQDTGLPAGQRYTTPGGKKGTQEGVLVPIQRIGVKKDDKGTVIPSWFKGRTSDYFHPEIGPEKFHLRSQRQRVWYLSPEVRKTIKGPGSPLPANNPSKVRLGFIYVAQDNGEKGKKLDVRLMVYFPAVGDMKPSYPKAITGKEKQVGGLFSLSPTKFVPWTVESSQIRPEELS